MEDRKKELEHQIYDLWLKKLRAQAEADAKQAEADYYSKLHDIAEQELEHIEKWGWVYD